MKPMIGGSAKKDWKKNVKVHPLLAARFAYHLKERRAARGLNLQACADLLDVSNPYISLLESGQRTPSLEMVEKTAHLFNVDPSAMLEDPK